MNRMILSLLCALFALAVWLQLDQNSFADTPSQREYRYSSDPGVKILVIRFTGGLRAGIHTNTIYGDGRYEYRLMGPQGEESEVERLELQLSDDEVKALLDGAVHAGLMEFDKAAVEQGMNASAPPFHVNDAVTLFVDIHLERYRASDEREVGPASHSMSFRAVGSHAKIFPEMEEIQALNEIAEAMKAFRQRAELQQAN